jgi:hypothetical protein
LRIQPRRRDRVLSLPTDERARSVGFISSADFALERNRTTESRATNSIGNHGVVHRMISPWAIKPDPRAPLCSPQPSQEARIPRHHRPPPSQGRERMAAAREFRRGRNPWWLPFGVRDWADWLRSVVRMLRAHSPGGIGGLGELISSSSRILCHGRRSTVAGPLGLRLR